MLQRYIWYQIHQGREKEHHQHTNSTLLLPLVFLWYTLLRLQVSIFLQALAFLDSKEQYLQIHIHQ